MSDTEPKDALTVASKDPEQQASRPLDKAEPIELREPEKAKPKPEPTVGPAAGPTIVPSATPSVDNSPEGSAEPATPQPAKTQDERFALPASFEERFILTREANRQELFRSYDDKRPAISDSGDMLKTKNADRSTAMDMIELAAHRGWSSMKVKGPEEFRREMWIEGTAQGIEVRGYRPNDKDRAEAERRGELIGDRVIERTDQGRITQGRQYESSAQYGDPVKDASNVVPMIDYQKGLEGKIIGIGAAPYRDREGASVTPFVALELADGRTHKLWGVGLPDMIGRHELKVGDKATIYDDGKKAVTVQERDSKTGEVREKETFRREWGARDIDRAAERVGNRVEPVQKTDEAVIEPMRDVEKSKEGANSPAKSDETNAVPPKPKQERHADRLEERLIQKEAAHDPKLRGAASTLALIDAEMRAAGMSDKDRTTVRDLASSELAKGIREGRQYDVQRLPNISASQHVAAKSLSAKDVSKIIEQARVRTPSRVDVAEKGKSKTTEQINEHSRPTERNKER